MPYYLIKTYEEVSSFEALAVQLRIHKGSLEAIENHWASWNGKFKKQRRYDKVIYSSDNRLVIHNSTEIFLTDEENKGVYSKRHKQHEE